MIKLSGTSLRRKKLCIELLKYTEPFDHRFDEFSRYKLMGAQIVHDVR